ncbi:MAG: 3-phosphoshikimate 1-carboxyvinyltransferase [Proteobacteria bacterium]|nr:3-phosphoshikimate 1-carboxyvinyltransferase [Pseudomonadota bacterium]MBU4296239.1 3-phosphoshikimate 1-carboxyvinyltransferase [Pseudomonadota bacterium]MCG2746403.1 3-phosphoshikimate 1-carboxyvinyltransferase [Desulfobulbaceae bacterium]
MIEIKPAQHIDAIITVPGSKSITQRALIAAALADGNSTLLTPLASEDTAYTSAALKAMGIAITPADDQWTVNGTGGRINTPDQEIFLGNNGTATRFLTSVAALGHGIFTIAGEKRMEERPIAPLMQALSGWGVDIVSIKGTGCPPLRIAADGIQGGKTTLPAGKSSQYLSSLLLVAPYARNKAILTVEGDVPSKPYVTMTMAVMRSFGIHVTASDSLNHFEISQGSYQPQTYQVEGDASSASYFFAAAAITGGTVTVTNVPEVSLQGDTALVNMLEKMGCTVIYGNGITVTGPKKLRGIEVDMGDCPDVAPTLAVVASRARGRTVIKNIAHLRIKECDRINAMATELSKLGARVVEEEDALIIEGLDPDVPMQGAEIETYNDHRIAMCFGVAGLVVPGIRITNEKCVAKSFPDYWDRFALLY